MTTPVLMSFFIDMDTLPVDIWSKLNNDYKLIRELICTKSLTQQGQKYLHVCSHGSGHGSKNKAMTFTPKFITMLVVLHLSKLQSISKERILVINGDSISLKKSDILMLSKTASPDFLDVPNLLPSSSPDVLPKKYKFILKKRTIPSLQRSSPSDESLPKKHKFILKKHYLTFII